MAISWREHPILKPPTDAEMAAMEPSALVDLHKIYHEAISNSENDPYRHVFVLDPWKKAEELLRQYDTLVTLGGNRSAKTSMGAWLVMRSAMENPGAMIVCFAQNAEMSVLVQQPAIYNFLPAELKGKKLGQAEYISYSKQNGFAGNSLILPNNSRILFKTYSQYQMNQTVLEGLELGAYQAQTVNLGAWCDEFLGGPEMLDTLVFRLATRNAKLLLTFTPIDGYTETVRLYMDGAKTLESRHAELLGNRLVPTVQKCRDKDAAIFYLHTKDNPWSGYDRVAKEAMAKDDESWVLCRVYGIPTRSISSKFPCFSREVNVVPHTEIPFIKDPEGAPAAIYMVLDPAGRKKWFMVWIAVDVTDTWWVYREWPDASHGDWAQWRAGKWLEGPGARRDGVVEGVEQYIDLIMQLERDGKEEPIMRLIDPRLGAQKYQGPTGASCIIDDLADGGMVFIPASGVDIDEGIQALQNKMAYNIRKKVDGSNRPRLYVSDRCENVIRSIQEYTGDGGKDEAWKDPLDCLRYAAVEDIRFVDSKLPTATAVGRGGY